MKLLEFFKYINIYYISFFNTTFILSPTGNYITHFVFGKIYTFFLLINDTHIAYFLDVFPILSLTSFFSLL